MALPLWPGFCFDRDLGKSNRPRIQVLDRIRDTTHTYYNDKLFKSKTPKKDDLPFEPRGAKGPSWVVYDKKVLCFDGYWLENVTEEPDKFYNCRSCKVFYYLEDDTVQVLEPRIRNSRLCQGTVVKRMKFLKSPPDDNLFYNIHDFNIGSILQLCGRHIKLTSCDNFTFNYLRRLGVDIKNPIPQPIDPVESLKNNLAGQKKGKGFYRKNDTLGQFLDYNKYILRFYCFFDNTDIYNDPRSMNLHYFLEDDTMEIMENLPNNCGREGRVFLKRQRLPKIYVPSSLDFSGKSNDPFYLNVIKTRNSHHKLVDSANLDENAVLFYRDCDLSLGQYINVYGRKFLLCDCDEFTKEFYRKKYGIFEFQSINMGKYWPQDMLIEKFIPPHNGWGTEEDSLRNCLSIRPTEIVRSNKQFIKSKKTIDDLLFINFLAKIYKPDTKYDIERRFIISYGIEDDQFLIMEYSTEGKTLFLLRNRHMKSKYVWKDIYIPEYYEAVDFYIGSIIYIKGLELLLFAADDYSLKYMEKNCHKFIHSSIERVLTKLRKRMIDSKTDMEYFFKTEDQLDTGLVSYKTLDAFKKYFANDILSEQELVTLGRFYTLKNSNTSPGSLWLIAKIRDILRINNFMDFYLIKEKWYAESPQDPKIPITTARNFLKSMRIPLSDEMLCDLFKLSCIEPDQVDLWTLLDIMEWQKFQPKYYEYVGKYFECDNDVNVLKSYPGSELLPEKHLKNSRNTTIIDFLARQAYPKNLNFLIKSFQDATKLTHGHIFLDFTQQCPHDLQIGDIQWKNLMNDVINHPQISKSHPSPQKSIFSQQCK